MLHSIKFAGTDQNDWNWILSMAFICLLTEMIRRMN